MEKKKSGISFIKELMTRHGPAYFAKIVEKNRQLLEEHDRYKRERENEHQNRRRKDSI